MTDTYRAHASETNASVFEVRIDAGGHVFIGDEPVAKGGAGIGPAPFDLLCAALAECTTMTVRWFAKQKGWPVDHVSTSVELEKVAASDRPGHVVDRYTKTVRIEGDGLSDEQRATLLEMAAKCPVQRSLEGSPRFQTFAAPE